MLYFKTINPNLIQGLIKSSADEIVIGKKDTLDPDGFVNVQGIE